MHAPDEELEDLFEQARDASPSAPSTASAPKIVLVVDDSPMIRRVVSTVVISMGHTVEEAGNGTEALAAAAAQPPDLVFLDLHMPEMDGLTTLRRMRQRPQLAKVPVVLLTAERAKEVVVEAAKFGVSDYLSKPARPERIREKVRRLLG